MMVFVLGFAGLVLSEGAWRKPGEHETLPRKSAPHRDVTRDGKGWEGKF